MTESSAVVTDALWRASKTFITGWVTVSKNTESIFEKKLWMSYRTSKSPLWHETWRVADQLTKFHLGSKTTTD